MKHDFWIDNDDFRSNCEEQFLDGRMTGFKFRFHLFVKESEIVRIARDRIFLFLTRAICT